MSAQPSSAQDQPEHKAFEPVELCAIDLEFKHLLSAEGTHSMVRLQEVGVRNAAMDPYGVGYDLEIETSSGRWKKAMLSRRNFGIDNFHVEVQMGNGFVRGLARVWCWSCDKELAENALKDKAQESFNRVKSMIDDLSAVVKSAELQAATRKSRAQPG